MLKHLTKNLITVGFIAITSLGGAFAAGNYYKELPQRVAPISGDDDTIEVIEVFSYACPACNDFEPFFKQWNESLHDDSSVKTLRLAASGNGVWELYAKTFYALEAMNELERGHQAFFDVIHKERKRFINEKQIAKFMRSIGIDEERFLKAWSSFSAKSSFNRAQTLLSEQYRIPYTPVVIVDGQYTVDAQSASTRPEPVSPYQKLILTVDELVHSIKAERSQVSATNEDAGVAIESSQKSETNSPTHKENGTTEQN